MEKPAWQFDANTIEEAITAASFADDADRIFITGKKFKEMVSVIISLREDINRCHALCTDLGIPDLGGGLQGIVARLEYSVKTRLGGKL